MLSGSVLALKSTSGSMTGSADSSSGPGSSSGGAGSSSASGSSGTAGVPGRGVKRLWAVQEMPLLRLVTARLVAKDSQLTNDFQQPSPVQPACQLYSSTAMLQGCRIQGVLLILGVVEVEEQQQQPQASVLDMRDCEHEVTNSLYRRPGHHISYGGRARLARCNLLTEIKVGDGHTACFDDWASKFHPACLRCSQSCMPSSGAVLC